MPQIVNSNSTTLTIGAVECTTSDIQVQRITIGRIFTGISTANHIQCIWEPNIARICITWRIRSRNILSRHIQVLSSRIDCTSANIDLTHTERDTAIQYTTSNSQFTLTRLINGRPPLCG